MAQVNPNGRFGTLPVFLTAISTILGAILFLRFGYAVGNLGFLQTCLIILIGHAVTIPTAFAIAEIATNQKVEGGGEYFIISRSFGLNVGAAIGSALYLSQAISVAFYVIAFGEAFVPILDVMSSYAGFEITKQMISLAGMSLLSLLILTKGAALGMSALYVVVAILFVSLCSFFFGGAVDGFTPTGEINAVTSNPAGFFTVFAICFPAFTGMTAGVGLSGDLRDPKKSIPLGTIAGTLVGMVMYIIIAYKLAYNAPPEMLADTNRMVMSDIAIVGWLIPVGLAAATVSSALGSILVAPRTLQAIGKDDIYPSKPLNRFFGSGRGKENEPFWASVVTIIISFAIISAGEVDAVAGIITMFFMVTYGSLCLISFLHHFNADPSYRPSFRSHWTVSLFGAIMCITLMFQIDAPKAIAAFACMALLYFIINYSNKEKRGVVAIFQGVIYQLSRNMRIYLQNSGDDENTSNESWRPSVICVSSSSFKRFSAFDLLRWISHRHGFGTYIHQVKGYYSKDTVEQSKEIMSRLKHQAEKLKSNVYLDTIISPSTTSAIAQCIQLPGVSGKDNNMVLFEFAKIDLKDETELKENEKDAFSKIQENFKLVKAGNFDICILASSPKRFGAHDSIHIWIKPNDVENANLMILLGYIISGNKDWKNSVIKIFSIATKENIEAEKQNIIDLTQDGRLPISVNNITMITLKEDQSIKERINEQSADAALTIIGFRQESVKMRGREMFDGYNQIGDILFVNSSGEKVIK